MQENKISITPDSITLLTVGCRQGDVSRKLSQASLLVDLFNYNFYCCRIYINKENIFTFLSNMKQMKFATCT